MPAPTTNRSYAGGHFEISLDDWRHSAYVRSFASGGQGSPMIIERFGHSSDVVKHRTKDQFDDLDFEIGMSSGKGVLAWLKDEWSGVHNPRGGQISWADVNMKIRASQRFDEAFLKEVTFPALGEGATDMYLKVKIQPVFSKIIEEGGSESTAGESNDKQKLWTAGAYRLTIDGMRDCFTFVNKVDSFKIATPIIPVMTGEEKRAGDFVRTGKFEWPTLTGTVSTAHAKALIKWNEDSRNQNDKKAEKTGMLEYLHPNRKDTLFSIDLYEVRLSKFEFDGGKANKSDIRRFKFSMDVGYMSLSASGLGIA